ncbi:MAG: LemA family protein [Candidatus Uhrbacteria bacterium]|nr:LemA family protein [Candidatus Uhrbacteria bacterium]
MEPVLFIIIGVVLVGGLWLVIVFNSLITSRNRVDESWSDIEVQLKRRYDLIPNLVNTVKGYAKHESSVFENVTKARTAAMSAGTAAEHAQAENMLSQTLKSLFAVAESYPDLKASGNFAHLQSELVDAEDKIQAARRFYNSQVRDFNTKLQVFPTNMVGNMLGFTKREFYDAPEVANATPNVQF